LKIESLILVHGGAWDIPTNMHQAHLEGINAALQVGQQILSKTNDSLQTIIEVVKCLENDSTFDAGTGSFLNSAGQVEMDAGIMVGKDLSVGAVAAIQNVRNPIEISNNIRENTQHIMLVGEGATSFAHENGFEDVPTEELLVGREKELYQKLKEQKDLKIKSFFENKNSDRDTVGAVVINDNGEIVAGTSTGGTPHKLQGRVGDSPIIGSGFYADDNVGGISATGWGEGIMRVMLAKNAADFVKQGMPAQKSAELAINEMYDRISGEGGLILIDRLGNYACAYNTPFMARGAASLDRILFTKIDR